MFNLFLSAVLWTSSAWAIKGGEPFFKVPFTTVVGLNNCSGTFITPRTILTAAHCIKNLELNTYSKIYPNTHSGSFLVKFINFIQHPGYSEGDLFLDKSLSEEERRHLQRLHYRHDIALIILSEPLDEKKIFNSVEKEILAALKTQELAGTIINQDVWAVGFGLSKPVPKGKGVSAVDSTLDKLMRTRLLVNNLTLIDELFVFKPTEDGVSVCGGDSGGALLAVGQTTTNLLGVIVATDGGYCTNNKVEQYFAPVELYLDWIKAHWQL